MLTWLNAMRIGPRIALGFLCPILGLVAFSGFVLFERVEALREAHDLRTRIEQAATESDAVQAVREAALRRLVADDAPAGIRRQVDHRITLLTAALVAQGLAVLFGLSLTLVIVVTITRGITGPLARLTAAMSRLAQGDTSAAIEDGGRRDEFGAMAAAVAVFRENRIEADRLAEAQTLAMTARENRRIAVDRLTAEFDDGITGILDVVGQAADGMAVTAERLSRGAGTATRRIADAAAAADTAARNVGEIAAATHQLTESIQSIVREVDHSTGIARDAVARAREADALVAGLSDAMQRIGEVTVLIHQIAGQTNLLALNATIEAARAGEAGRGFAVVASEVKSLADRTARATDEIAAQTTAVQDAMDRAVGAIQAIGVTIAAMDRVTATVAAAVEQQSGVVRAIGANLNEAAGGTRAVSANVGEVVESSRENGRSAESVRLASEALLRQSHSLRDHTERFLAGVRSA